MAEGDWPLEGDAQQERKGRRWRALALVAGILAFGLLVGIIHVSTFEVRYGTQVFAQPRWVVGQRVALRVVVLDLAASTYQWGVKVKATLEPAQGGQGRPLGEGVIERSRSLELNPQLPRALAPGPYRLVLRLEVPGDEPEIVRMPVEVVAASTAPAEIGLSLRNVCEEGRYRELSGTWSRSTRCKERPRTRLYPESGTLVGNLVNRVFVWTPAEGPALRWRLRRPPPGPGMKAPDTEVELETIEVDSLGIGELKLRPGYPRQRLELFEGETARNLWLRDAPTQILVQTERSMQRSDETFVAEIESMRRDVPLFLDLWLEGRWIGADSVMLDGSESLRYEVALPPEAEGLAVLRVSTSPDGRSGTGDHRVIFIDSRAETAQGLRRLVGRLAKVEAAQPQGVDEFEVLRESAPEELLALEPHQFARVDRDGLDRAAALLLSRLEVGPDRAPLLGDDSQRKRQRLAAWKQSVRRPMIAGLVLLLFVVFVLVAISVSRARREMRARLLEIQLESDDEDGAAVASLSSGGLGLSALLLLAVLVAAVFGLVVLLETLRWDLGQ